MVEGAEDLIPVVAAEFLYHRRIISIEDLYLTNPKVTREAEQVVSARPDSLVSLASSAEGSPAVNFDARLRAGLWIRALNCDVWGSGAKYGVIIELPAPQAQEL